MGNFIIQLPKDVEMVERIEKVRTAVKKQLLMKVYITELKDYDEDKQTWLFIYKPLVFPFYWFIYISAFASSLFLGFNKVFWILFSIAAISNLFFSCYIPKLVVYLRMRHKHVTFV